MHKSTSVLTIIAYLLAFPFLVILAVMRDQP